MILLIPKSLKGIVQNLFRESATQLLLCREQANLLPHDKLEMPNRFKSIKHRYDMGL